MGKIGLTGPGGKTFRLQFPEIPNHFTRLESDARSSAYWDPNCTCANSTNRLKTVNRKFTAPPIILVAVVSKDSIFSRDVRGIVDDDPLLKLAGVWKSTEAALEAISVAIPDVLLFSCSASSTRKSNAEAIVRLKRCSPTLDVVIVTPHCDHESIFSALRSGASGYLLRDGDVAKLRSAIHEVVRGGAPMTPGIARKLVDSLHGATTPNIGLEDSLKLTSKESQVLRMISQGLTNEDIARHLKIVRNTVRVHIRNAYRKLRIHTRTQAAIRFSDST